MHEITIKATTADAVLLMLLVAYCTPRRGCYEKSGISIRRIRGRYTPGGADFYFQYRLEGC